MTLRDRMESAEAWVAGREGSVAVAVVGAGGERRGRDEHRLFPSASVVKSMLLVGELRRLREEGLPLDSGTASTLASMIEYSDNDAADAIYARVGDEGLLDVAEDAGMRDFEVDLSWGYAQISAADMALLFSRLDRVLPARDREFAKGLLGSVVAEQSWGIPAAAEGWSARFKGGWRTTEAGQLVSQAAELRRDGRAISLAVLTDGQPSMEYGIATVEGVAERVVPPAPRGG